MDLVPRDNQIEAGVINKKELPATDANWPKNKRLLEGPFRLYAAEQELLYHLNMGQRFQYKFDPDEEQARLSSLAFFVLPLNMIEPGRSLIETLRRDKTAFIYGEPGAGKTSLRLALETECRRVTDGTLAVTCVLPAGGGHNSVADINWSHLARNLAIDAFIQALERFNLYETPPTGQQIEVLGRLLSLGGENLRRVAHKIVSAEPEILIQTQWGAGRFESGVGRFPMRYVHISTELQTFVGKVLQIAATTNAATGKKAWDEGILTARAWGFNRILLLIDGVDSVGFTVPEMLDLLRPFLQQIVPWRKQDVVARYFLPTSLQPDVEILMNGLSEISVEDWFAVKLEWTSETLKQLLKARFRAAGSRRVGFADLEDSTLEKSLGKALDELLIEAANGLPRNLLQLISRLVDRLVMTRQERVTPALWDSLLRQIKQETNNAFSTNGVSVRPYPRRKIS